MKRNRNSKTNKIKLRSAATSLFDVRRWTFDVGRSSFKPTPYGINTTCEHLQNSCANGASPHCLDSRIRKMFIPGAFFFLASIAVSVLSMESNIFLSPPGLRLIRDPSLVIPADFHYANRLIKLPAYRDPSGNPASGWSAKFVDTRRFASDQSAWIFFRNSDLQQSGSMRKAGDRGAFRFWPVGTTIIIEIYKGNGFQKENDKLIEIAAMSKIKADKNSLFKSFYPVNWTYARFNPDGNPFLTSAKVRECHQCHSIAFHLTGDLIFTRFP